MSIPPPPDPSSAGSENWPPDLAELHDAACEAFLAGAYAATGVICRQLLAMWASRESLSGCVMLLEYMDEITGAPLTEPEAQTGKDQSRRPANSPDQSVRMTTRDEASRALAFIRHLLTGVYRTPGT
jgi:hypothetical protein